MRYLNQNNDQLDLLQGGEEVFVDKTRNVGVVLGEKDIKAEQKGIKE